MWGVVFTAYVVFLFLFFLFCEENKFCVRGDVSGLPSGCIFSFLWYVEEQIVSAVHVLLAIFVRKRQAG